MPSRWHYYLIFAFSGGAALIYESLWARYLKIFLGHAAYAQSLILAVFLFGLAAGSMLAARYVARMSRPLLAYAAVEAVLALFAMYFHDIFVVAQAWALDDILPRLPVGGDVFKWTLGACLALPQTILLGATFPLLAAAIMRRWPKSPGNTVSVLYFSNSFGAALGVLAGGFALTPALGLPGAMLVGGIINAVIAALVWFFSRRFGEPPINTATENSGDDSFADSNESESIANSSAHAEDAKEKNVATGVDSDSHADSTLVKVLLAASAITGMSSFIYEIIWTRLISLLLGASTYSFEIMLAVFIFGLALGGWLIRRRADRPASLSLLAKVQIAMGLLALLSLPLYPWLFKLYVHYWPGGAPGEWVHWRFFLFGGALAMALILPSAVCAGMTLPLITRRLLQSQGESALGSVYAANTLGAIVGVVATVNWLLPETGVKNAMIIGAGADLILGCCLFYYARERSSVSVSSLISAAAAAAVFVFGGVPLKVAASGAYRTGNLLGDDFKVVFYRDGKTASVSVLENENLLSIRTNGKADASIHKDSESYTSDETTMTMSGLLPLLARPDARLAANIGFGSGLTSRTLLLSPNLQRLDNIEIEPMMALGARRMGERVEPVFSDPRNHFIFDDAKTVFARATERYDIIVSEPSNPWISGIGGLFTREFYRRVRRSLNDNGVFVQWLPFYDNTPHIFASALSALSESFSDYRMYASAGSDAIILAVAEGEMPPLQNDIFAYAEARDFLKFYDYHAAGDLAPLFIGGSRFMTPYFRSFSAPVNSDYFPYLEYEAPLAFYRKTFYSWGTAQHLPVPFMEMAGAKPPPSDLAETAMSRSSLSHKAAVVRDLFADIGNPEGALRGRMAGVISSACAEGDEEEQKHLVELSDIVVRLMPHASSARMAEMWELLAANECIARRLSSEDESLAGNYTRFWRSLSLRDAAGIAKAAEALLPQADLYAASGQTIMVGAMAAHYREGRHDRVLSLLSQMPQTNPALHHAARFLGALSAEKL